jgi:molybdopterin/thiamine biosynthesis adenylyltransferase
MTHSNDDVEECLRQFAEKSPVDWARDDDNPGTVVGEFEIEGTEATLRLQVPSFFPTELPDVYVEPWDASGFIPHVQADGQVCYQETEGMVVDRRSPISILQGALDKALSVLRAGAQGNNEDVFAEEFESYWRRLENATPIWSLIEATDQPRLIRRAEKDDTVFLADGEEQISAFLNGSSVKGAFTIQKALYVPLKKSARVVPPRPDGPLWSDERIREVVWQNVAPAFEDKVRELCEELSGQTTTVVLGVPKETEGRSLVGIRYKGVETEHPLLPESSSWKRTPLVLSRMDHGYIAPRSGAETELSSRSVLLVGGGAVGGHLSLELGRAGAGEITLVDPEKLRPENTYRHALGRSHWSDNKAKALKDRLESKLPYLECEAFPCKIQKALHRGDIDLRDYDLIVCATGDMTLEMGLNEHVDGMEATPPLLHAWLEPYGIGGHVLVSGNEETGCLECLFTSSSGKERLHSRAAFAQKGQDFGRRLAGCGSLHTPYGSADALRTAELATRLATDVLTGREEGNPLRSWKGDPEKFLAEGYQLSNRFSLTSEQLEKQKYAYVAGGCPVCG